MSIGSMSYYFTLKSLDPDGSKGIFAPNNLNYGGNCHWCNEGRPFMPGTEGKQHVPLHGGDGEHSGTMCYNSDIYKLVDQTTAARPQIRGEESPNSIEHRTG